mgnify:CR=1 FL=1
MPPACGHGVAGEIDPYRGVRIWVMNCGEVACELSTLDFFQPAYMHEWIDAALSGKTDGWREIDLERLAAIRKKQTI